jgi:tungstate transport system substrate-binding protein
VNFCRTMLAVLFGGLALFAAPLSATAGDTSRRSSMVLAPTTSVDDSGLLQHILPEFTRKTGIEVRVVAVGTGQALAIAARGDADLVLVHDPDAEQEFMAAGHGATRMEIAWNDFVIVGPSADPAHIAGTQNAATAFEAIWNTRAPFVSRGDKSGTETKEKRLWRAAGIDPEQAKGGWYRAIGGGMGAALNVAAAMDAYTLCDRGTWLSFANKRGLRIMVEGDRDLLNRYDIITLDPKEHTSAANKPAQSLADWLTSPEGQRAIGAYVVAGERAFHPETDPKP